MKQNLCEQGKKLRAAFREMDATLLDYRRYRIVQEYFQHKARCKDCDIIWRNEADADNR